MELTRLTDFPVAGPVPSLVATRRVESCTFSPLEDEPCESSWPEPNLGSSCSAYPVPLLSRGGCETALRGLIVRSEARPFVSPCVTSVRQLYPHLLHALCRCSN